jgi:hypothetical protein
MGKGNESMDLHDWTAVATRIWGPEPTPLHDGILSVLIPLADIARQARTGLEGGQVDREELAKEYGNLILTTLRFIRDAGLDPDFCVRLAEDAQRRYASRLGG